METYQLEWTESALDSLETNLAYVAFHGSEPAAERLRQGISEHTALLASFPFLGPLYRRGMKKEIREIAYKQYRIFYRVLEDEKRVQILTVWHGSRQEPDFGGGRQPG